MQNVIPFLNKLAANNNREWFQEHKGEYTQAYSEFSNFVELLIKDWAQQDATIIGLNIKECLFRINRDVRFSNDKSPYKLNFGASIARGGRKSIFAGYYIHAEPGNSFIGGGLYMPTPEILNKVRKEIYYNNAEFKSIVNGNKFYSLYGKLDDFDKLKKAPKGFDPNFEDIEFLKHKSYIAGRTLKDEELISKDFSHNAIAAFALLKPLCDFINRAIVD